MSDMLFAFNGGVSISAKKLMQMLAAMMMLFLTCLPLLSQGSQGTIQGSLFDQSGGAVADAAVTVTDIARGTSRTLVTDSDGQYVAASLNPGTYTVRAAAKGFKTIEHSGVLVEVGQNIRVDLVVQPGEQSETVTVTAEIPPIDTTDATLGGSVSNQSILSLPLNGRNFFRLLDLRPGVVTPPGISSGSTSTNGRRLGTDVLLVEGITQFDMATSNNLINGSGKGSSGDASNLLPLDAVQEFSTQQNPPAEYGWRDGSVINVGIKSGTNSLHGSVYAFGRDAAATDAANFFSSTVTPATLAQFGGAAGGRIIKDKLFWFAAYEGQRVDVGNVTQETFVADIPFAIPNTGLSMVDACNGLTNSGSNFAAISPLSGLLAGLDTIVGGVPTVMTCVPQQPSSSVENVFPYNPTTTTSFFPNTTNNLPLNNGLAKLDWVPTDHHRVSFFYYNSRSVQTLGGPVQSYWGTTGISNTEEYTGRWTWTPSSIWVNDLTAGWAGALGNSVPGDVNALPVNAWTGVPPSGYSMNTGVTNALYGGFPTITLDSLGSNFQLGVGGKPGVRGPQGQLNIRDTVSYLRGNHAFKFGAEYVRVVFDDGSHANVVGTVAFPSLEGFLQGIYDTGANITIGDTDVRQRANWYAGFVEDTWRVTHKITITPGLRYEYDGPPHEVDNNLGTFLPGSTTGIVQVGPGLPISELYKPEKADFSPRMGIAWDVRGTGRTVVRSGASLLYSWPGMTALAQQTPFGASFYGPNNTLVVDNSKSPLNHDFPQNFTYPITSTNPNPLTWNTVGPIFPISSTIAQCGVGVASGTPPVTIPQCGTFATDPNFKRAKSINWDIDIQHALSNNFSLDVAYVGNHGWNETYTKDLNAVPLGTGYTPAVIAACVANASATNCTPSSTAITNARSYNAQYPWLNYIDRTTYGYFSNYSGLQITVDSRDYHGLSFLAAYTYGHALDEWTKSSQGTSVVVNPSNPRVQYGNSDYDIRHRFRFSPTYNAPGMKSPGQMLEGWQISGIVSLQTGLPWGAIDATKDDFAGTGENANNVIPNPNGGMIQPWNYSGPASAFETTNQPIPCFTGVNSKGSAVLSGCTKFTVNTWATLVANPNADPNFASCLAGEPYAPTPLTQASPYTLAAAAIFNNGCYIRAGGILTPPAYGTVGNAGRNSFFGAPFENLDMTIAKTWHWKERYSAQFRFEVFNVTNHTTFGPVPGNPVDSPSGGLNGHFGTATSTPDSGNPVFGSGGPRHIQFGLKLAF